MYNNGDIAWTLTSAMLVWLMIPGLGYMYSTVLTLVTSVYPKHPPQPLPSHPFPEYFGLKGVLDTPAMGSTRLPALVFCLYQLMFATATAMISLGALAECGHLAPVPVFIFVWCGRCLCTTQSHVVHGQ